MALGRSMLCPVVVGRDPELEFLRAGVDRAADGHGGLLTVVGEAGSGKSRLGRETMAYAKEQGLVTLSGRAVAGDTPVPYRPLTEALLGAFRSGGPPEAPELAGFEGHLGRLVPAWRVGDERGADESPVLLGEAAVRVLGLVARPAGAVVVFEDLHWADVETLAVVEYLADALAEEPVLCLVTCRPENADTVSRLRRHPAAPVVELTPLKEIEVAELVAASLAVSDPPAEVVTFITTHSDGNPFLAEELLAGLVTSGTLVYDDGWIATGILTPTVPTDVADSIRTRTAAFTPTTRVVLGAAAVLGRRFDWNLLPGVAETDGRAVVDALRQGVDNQLVEVDGQEFRFRHMLTREAILADLLPPERRELSRRAWPAIEHAHPGLPGPWCELAAELAEASGERASAAERLVESARRALDAGALATAETTARRARALAAGSTVGIDADECFVQVTAAAGKSADALAIGRPLATRMDAANISVERRIGLLVVLTRAAVAAGELDLAADLTDTARALVDAEGLDALLANVEAVASHVALDRVELAEAETLARAAVDHATATGQPAVACEALEVLGRVARNRSSDEAIAAFELSAATAEAHDLTGWLLRARQELALERWGLGDASTLQETRDLAADHGAMITVAVMDLSLADVALSSFDREACLERAHACAVASRRYGLATLPVAELWLAGGHALAGDAEAMEAAAARALASNPDDPRILGDLWGRVRATLHMVLDDRDRVRADLDQMMEHVAVAPLTTSIFPNRLVWVVLHAAEDDDLGVAARSELEDLPHLRWWEVLDSVLDVARAIALGRQGRGEEASALVAEGLEQSRQFAIASGTGHYVQLLLAESQLRDGWGQPVPLLRRAEAFFAVRGYDAIARRCRVALGAAGEKMPRRGGSEIPEHLRAVGVTSREFDVLNLIIEGCSNREISERLHVSLKTVEHHVSSLFDRTGIRNRTDLAAWVGQAAN